MNSAVIVIGLPFHAFPESFQDWSKLSSYECCGENTDPSAVIYGIEVVEACETWKVLKGVTVMVKIGEAGKEFKEIVGKDGAIILTIDQRDY